MFLWLQNLPLVRRERRNGSNSSYNCTPFLHSLLTKCKKNLFDGSIQDVPSSRVIAESPLGDGRRHALHRGSNPADDG